MTQFFGARIIIVGKKISPSFKSSLVVAVIPPYSLYFLHSRLSSMKVQLQLQPGSIGIGFDGCPVVVRKVVETSPYYSFVAPHKSVVTGMTIPGVVQIEGMDMDATFLIALLKEYSDLPGKILNIDERPFLIQKHIRSVPKHPKAKNEYEEAIVKADNEEKKETTPVQEQENKKVSLERVETTNEPTIWRVNLPAGKLGITFGDAANFGGPVVDCVEGDSPLASVIVPGLQFRALEIPGVAYFENILHGERITELLESFESVEDRVLHLFMPLNEVAAATYMPNSLEPTGEFTTVPLRYVPLAGNSLCKIEGSASQMATVRLCSGQTIQAADQSMVWMSDNVMEDHSRGRSDSFTRISADERISLSVYTVPPKESTDGEVQKSSPAYGTLAMAPSYSAKIFVVDLEDYGGTIIAGSRNFLFTNDEGVMLFSYAPVQNPPSPATSPANAPKSTSPKNIFEGKIRMHRIMGKGKVFLTAGGCVSQKTLRRGETIRVSTRNLAAYEFGMTISLEGVKGLGIVVVWGQGTAVLTGPGTAWIESQPSARHGLLEKR